MKGKVNNMYTTILYEVKNNIGFITLNRPEVGNAMIPDSYREIKDALVRAGADEGVRSILITGTGRFFSAGGDIKRFKSLIQSEDFIKEENILAAGQMAIAAKKCPKPIVAQVNGAAAGAGCCLALACDFRVMDPKSKLSMAFIKLGLSGDTGALYHLEKLVGVAKATQMMMTGDPISAEEAYSLGLTTILADEGKLADESLKLAEKLAASPGFAIARQKELIYEYFYGDFESYLQKEAKFMAESSRTQDFSIAVDAFLEKRQAEFVGK